MTEHFTLLQPFSKSVLSSVGSPRLHSRHPRPRRMPPPGPGVLLDPAWGGCPCWPPCGDGNPLAGNTRHNEHAMSDVPGAARRLVKPRLRGSLRSSTVFHLMTAIAMSATAAISTKLFLGDWRKNQYAEFYKDYDAEADFARMQAAGVLSSAPPIPPPPPEDDKKKKKK